MLEKIEILSKSFEKKYVLINTVLNEQLPGKLLNLVTYRFLCIHWKLRIVEYSMSSSFYFGGIHRYLPFGGIYRNLPHLYSKEYRYDAERKVYVCNKLHNFEWVSSRNYRGNCSLRYQLHRVITHFVVWVHVISPLVEYIEIPPILHENCGYEWR